MTQKQLPLKFIKSYGVIVRSNRQINLNTAGVLYNVRDGIVASSHSDKIPMQLWPFYAILMTKWIV